MLAFLFYLLWLRHYKAKYVKTRCLQGLGHLEPRFQGEVVVPCQYIDTTRKAIECATAFTADSFYIMKLCSRLFVLYCRNCPKDDKFKYFIHIFRKFRGGVEPWLMARWKARVEFLLSVIGRLFLPLTVEALQGKRCQDSLLSGADRSVRAHISGGRGRPC